MVCNPKTPTVLHVPDNHALATCPLCRERRPVSYYDLAKSGYPLDGRPESICPACTEKIGAKRKRYQGKPA